MKNKLVSIESQLIRIVPLEKKLEYIEKNFPREPLKVACLVLHKKTRKLEKINKKNKW